MKNIAQHRPDTFETSKIGREQAFVTAWTLLEPMRAIVVPFQTQNARRERLFAVEWVSSEPMLNRIESRAVNDSSPTHRGWDYCCEWS
jgi:hypothetical protein